MRRTYYVLPVRALRTVRARSSASVSQVCERVRVRQAVPRVGVSSVRRASLITSENVIAKRGSETGNTQLGVPAETAGFPSVWPTAGPL